jgi:hypothetical protein
MQIERIHAIATAPDHIKAALATPEIRAISASAKRAGLDLTKGAVKLAQIDDHLKLAQISVSDRLAIKSAMDRAGLIDRS